MGSNIHLSIFKGTVMTGSSLPYLPSSSDTLYQIFPLLLNMHVLELFSFSASTALLADPSLATPILEYFKKIEGCLSVYYGYEIEQKTRLMIVISWRTYDHFQRSLKRDDYDSFISSLKTSLPSSLEVEVSVFDEDPSPMLAAPVTDFSLIIVRPGTSSEVVKDVFRQMDETKSKVKLLTDPTSNYPTKLIQGTIKTTTEPFYRLVCGWESREKHHEYVKKATGIEESELNINQIISVLEDLNIRHAALKSA